MKYFFLLLIELLGCSGDLPATDPEPTLDSGIEIEDEAENHPICIPDVCNDNECGFKSDGCGGLATCPVTCKLPFKCGLVQSNVCGCIPRSIDEICPYNQCGFVNDGCGAWILCGNGDVTQCINCWGAANKITCEAGYFPYQCAPNIFPLGCFRVGGTNLWCCQLFN